MEHLFIRVPFANNGEVSKLDFSIKPDGSVSWAEGWGSDYEKDLYTHPKAKAVERKAMNFVLNAVTVALKQYQTCAFPEFITREDNAGFAYPYSIGTVVRYRKNTEETFKNYVSLIDNNTSMPGSDLNKWQEFIFSEASAMEASEGNSSVKIITPRRLKKVADDLEEKVITNLTPFILPVGAIILWDGDEAPDGWLELNGQLFDVEQNPKLYKKYPDGRVPDWRGRVPRGWAHGSTTDPDSSRDVGSFQDDTIQNITGSFPADIGESWLIGNPYYVSGAFYDAGAAGSGDTGSKSNEVRRYIFDASRVVRTSTETRMKNVAVMYIIKTDQSESENETNLPTGLVVSPSESIIEQGGTVQLTAKVLPASLTSEYPITWNVADESLGSINSDGVYSAASNACGVQTVIASISTGLSVTAKITQHIFIERIIFNAIPDLVENGEPVSPDVTFIPPNYTEPLEYSSSDYSIASFSDNKIYPLSPGDAITSVKGSYSNISASMKVTVQPEIIKEIYLGIANHLSEIAEEGEEAQKEARGYLGLGSLATKDELKAVDVGASPMLNESLAVDVDLNELTAPGDYFQSISSYATSEKHYPIAKAGAIRVVQTGVSDRACRQFYWPYDSGTEYRRYGYGEPLVFSSWTPH